MSRSIPTPPTRPAIGFLPSNVLGVRAMAIAALLTGGLAVPAIASPATTASSVVSDEEMVPTVYWQGSPVEPGTLPAEWSPTTTQRVQELQRWVPSDDYTITVCDAQRVILLTPSGSMHKKRWRLVEKVLQEFDALLPPIEGRDLSKETYRVASTGYGDHRPDQEPVVLVEAGDESDYSSVVRGLAERHPHLTQWSQRASLEPGFIDSASQTGAIQSNPSGIEIGDVWRSENELVHRLGVLLLTRSYGPMPHWMVTSVGWHMEQSVLGDLYHFPKREEFISIASHSGWKSELKREFKKGQELNPELFMDWSRSQWNAPKAHLAWGLGQFLSEVHPGQLSLVAERFRQHYKQHSAIDHGDGSWSRIAGYEIPVADQEAILKEMLGETVFEDAGQYFKTWKKPRPKRGKKSKASR